MQHLEPPCHTLLFFQLGFMREHRIESNWRTRSCVDHQKILKGHDDHVITCLQFSNNRIVSGSDDNTLKVRFYGQSFLVGGQVTHAPVSGNEIF